VNHTLIGIRLSCLKQPFKKALLTAARLGAKAVEIDARNDLPSGELSQTGQRQLRKMLEDLNLRVSAIRFPTRRGYDDRENLDRRVAATRHAMGLAYALGARVVVNQIGSVPEDPSSEAWTHLVGVMTDLGRHGQHVGALFAAETGCESGQTLAQLLSALPDGFVGADLNPGNLIVHGHSPSQAVRHLGVLIQHVHATDAVQDRSAGKGLAVPLGQGSADFPELLGQLEQIGYHGFLTIGQPAGSSVTEELALAVNYLNNL